MQSARFAGLRTPYLGSTRPDQASVTFFRCGPGPRRKRESIHADVESPCGTLPAFGPGCPKGPRRRGGCGASGTCRPCQARPWPVRPNGPQSHPGLTLRDSDGRAPAGVRGPFDQAKRTPLPSVLSTRSSGGRQRGAGLGGGTDERESRPQPALVEMDRPRAPTRVGGPAATNVQHILTLPSSPGPLDRVIHRARPTPRAGRRFSRSTPATSPWPRMWI